MHSGNGERILWETGEQKKPAATNEEELARSKKRKLFLSSRDRRKMEQNFFPCLFHMKRVGSRATVAQGQFLPGINPISCDPSGAIP